MAGDTHSQAAVWASERLGAEDIGTGATYHLRDPNGRRIRVAARHTEGRQPNFFALGNTLEGDPFDDVVVVLFESDWSVRYAYRLSLDAARDHHKQPGRQGCRLMIRGDDSWRSDLARRRALPQTPADDRAGVRPDEVQPRHRPLPTTRTRRRQDRMAADHGDAQPAQAPPKRPRSPKRAERVPEPAARRTSPLPSRSCRRPGPQTYATASGRSGSGDPRAAFQRKEPVTRRLLGRQRK
jgi:hypothetical protein